MEKGQCLTEPSPICNMLKRVRGKEAKRKAENDENEQRPTKLQCEREERIAVLQLKAYWDCFALPAKETQAGQARADENSEEELIDDDGQDLWSNLKPGPCDDPNQELVADKAEAKQSHRTNGDGGGKAKQTANKANPERRQYLAEFRDLIKVEGKATWEKRRKLDPSNSGESPSALNGKVEHASKDLVQKRIKGEGQPTSFKRGIK